MEMQYNDVFFEAIINMCYWEYKEKLENIDKVEVRYFYIFEDKIITTNGNFNYGYDLIDGRYYKLWVYRSHMLIKFKNRKRYYGSNYVHSNETYFISKYYDPQFLYTIDNKHIDILNSFYWLQEVKKMRLFTAHSDLNIRYNE